MSISIHRVESGFDSVSFRSCVVRPSFLGMRYTPLGSAEKSITVYRLCIDGQRCLFCVKTVLRTRLRAPIRIPRQLWSCVSPCHNWNAARPFAARLRGYIDVFARTVALTAPFTGKDGLCGPHTGRAGLPRARSALSRAVRGRSAWSGPTRRGPHRACCGPDNGPFPV